MTLPTSAESPQAPYLTFDIENMPSIPNVNGIPDLLNVIVPLTVAIANEITNKANVHAGRMLLFNMASNQGWYNSKFKDVVQSAVDLITLMYRRKSISYPEQGIADAVVQSVTHMTSRLFIDYPELRSLVKPEVAEAALQNTHFFHTKSQEIAAMYQNEPHYGPLYNNNSPAHYPNNQPRVWSNAPMVQQPQHNLDWNNQPVMQAQPMNHNWVNNNNNQFSPPGFHGNQGSNYPVHNGSTFTNNFAPQVPTMANGVIGDRFNTRSVAAPPPERQAPIDFRNQQAQQPFLQPIVNINSAPVNTVNKQNLIPEIREMDRSKHQISYFGGSYNVPTIQRNDQYSATARTLAKLYVNLEFDDDLVVFDKNIAVEPNLDSAITCGQVKQFEHRNDNPDMAIFRSFFVIANPIINPEIISDYLKTLQESESFEVLIMKIKTIAMSLSVIKDKPQFTQNIINFLNQIDRKVASLLNDFLANKLLVKYYLVNFCEDHQDVIDALRANFEPQFLKAYEEFETEVITTLFETNLEQEISNELAERAGLTENMNYALLPVSHSITHICMSDTELNFKLKNNTVEIDPSLAPNLYAIAASLVEHKKQMGFSTLVDLLVTADDVRYKIHTSPLREEVFYISKA